MIGISTASTMPGTTAPHQQDQQRFEQGCGGGGAPFDLACLVVGCVRQHLGQLAGGFAHFDQPDQHGRKRRAQGAG